MLPKIPLDLLRDITNIMIVLLFVFAYLCTEIPDMYTKSLLFLAPVLLVINYGTHYILSLKD